MKSLEAAFSNRPPIKERLSKKLDSAAGHYAT